jgi:hypothetical protein
MVARRRPAQGPHITDDTAAAAGTDGANRIDAAVLAARRP